MSTIKLPGTDRLSLVVRGDDVIVRGESGRTDIEILAPKVSDPDAVTASADTTPPSRLELPGPVTIRAPIGLSLDLEGEPDGVVLKRVGEVSLAGCSGNLVVNQAKMLAAGAVKGDAAVRSVSATVEVASVAGDLAAAHIEEMDIGPVGGDASISHVRRVSLDQVGGDLTISRGGEIQVGAVKGDAALSSYDGGASLRSVGGELKVSSPGTSLAAAQVGGDAVLRGPLTAGGKYWMTAGGDVAVRVSGDVRMQVRAGGEVTAGEELTVEKGEDGTVVALLGRGETRAELNIDAGGDVILNSPVNWHRHHSAVVDAELRRAMKEVRDELRKAAVTVKMEMGRMGREMAKELGEEGWSKSATISIRSILRDLLDSLEAKPEATPGAAAGPPLQSEELRRILDMLEQGIITAEEAAQLIEALSH